MAFTYVTLTHTFETAGDVAAQGTLEFTPVAPMTNGLTVIKAPVKATLSGSGGLSVRIAANTDPDTFPAGTTYQVVEKITGQPLNTYYVQVPHDQGSTVDLGTLTGWVGGGSTGGGTGGVSSVNGKTGAVTLSASDVGAQPADPDLTALGGLDDGYPRRVGGAWQVQTLGQLAADLSASGSGAARYTRGVNLAGAEFAADAAHLPGTYATDYAYPAAAEIQAMAARGHKIVRVPFRWERIQPTRGAALNSTELGRLHAVVDAARTAGLRVVLDVHNFARYIPSGGAELVLGTSSLPVSDLVDLWTRLSASFVNDPGIYAYGLMNEPHDLLPVAGSFTGTTRYDWASGVQGWTGDTATASNVGGKLRLSASVGSGTVLFRKDDAATVSGGSGPTGNVLRAEVTLVSGSTAGTWTARLQWQDNAFTWQNATSISYSRVDTGASVAGLVTGVPVYVTCTFPSIANPPKAFAVQIDGTGVTAGTCTVDVDNFAQGSVSGSKTGAQVWENASQQVVTAIRAAGDTTLIMVPGYGFSGAQSWTTNHPGPWITAGGDIAYEAHYYFDSDNSGDYPDTYATETSLAAAAGYASLAARATAEMSVFTGWCAANNVRGFIGEMGWPNTGDTTGWNTVGEACYDLLDSARIDATYWAAGARWGTSYILSLYTGTNQDTVKSQAPVVEAHPTTYVDAPAQLDELDDRVSLLEAESGPRCAVPHRGLAFMVIGAETPSELATARAAGATHALVQVFWDQHQSAAGGAVNAATVLTRISDALAAGLKVCLRVSLQYPPAFVKSAVPAFKKQGGTSWSADPASGEDIRDWVWSRTGRSYVGDFLAKLFGQLDWSHIERVQLGGLRAGELSFPVSDGTDWWGFSTPAQSGTDLAPRMAVCPVPAYTPSTGTTWTDNDRLFVGWYLQSLTNWMIWLIEQHRRWFSGPIWVLHPGFGLRTYMDPTGSSALAYREMVANGLDWAGQIGAYPDDRCHPYSTWVDAAHSGGQPYSTVNDGDAAAWLHLLKVARSLGRGGRLWGENTGGQDNTAMDTVFHTGALAHGYEGVTWLNHDSLADGTTDTYANFTARTSEAA